MRNSLKLACTSVYLLVESIFSVLLLCFLAKSVYLRVYQCSEATAGQRPAACLTKSGKLSVKYFWREREGQTQDRQTDRRWTIRNAASYRGPRNNQSVVTFLLNKNIHIKTRRDAGTQYIVVLLLNGLQLWHWHLPMIWRLKTAVILLLNKSW